METEEAVIGRHDPSEPRAELNRRRLSFNQKLLHVLNESVQWTNARNRSVRVRVFDGGNRRGGNGRGGLTLGSSSGLAIVGLQGQEGQHQPEECSKAHSNSDRVSRTRFLGSVGHVETRVIEKLVLDLNAHRTDSFHDLLVARFSRKGTANRLTVGQQDRSGPVIAHGLGRDD